MSGGQDHHNLTSCQLRNLTCLTTPGVLLQLVPLANNAGGSPRPNKADEFWSVPASDQLRDNGKPATSILPVTGRRSGLINLWQQAASSNHLRSSGVQSEYFVSKFHARQKAAQDGPFSRCEHHRGMAVGKKQNTLRRNDTFTTV